MKYRITKSQFNAATQKLLQNFFGTIYTNPTQMVREEDFIELYTESGRNFADIWIKGSSPITKGCKKEISIGFTELEHFEKFLPIIRKKEFSKAVIDFVYKHTGIKCDCVQFEFEFKEENDLFDSKTYQYKSKKK
jgi:hypothetical protein